MVDETQTPQSNDASDADVMKAASQTFPQYSPDLIASTVQNVKKVHPELTNSMIIQDVIPQLQQSMKSGDFQKMAVQQSIKSKMGVGNTGTLPAQQEQAAAVVPNNVAPGMTQQQKMQQAAMGAYPDVQKELGDQFAQQQSMQVTGQDATLKTQENAQKNVGYQQNQSVAQDKVNPDSDVNKWFRQQMQALSPNSPVPVNLTVANSGDIGEKFFDLSLKKYGMSGMPSMNSAMGTQAANYNPANLDAAKEAAAAGFKQLQTALTPLLKSGALDKQLTSSALQLFQAQPGSPDAIAASQALEAAGHGDLISGIHSLQVANNLSGAGSGGTDFALRQSLSDMLATNNPEAFASSGSRTINRINQLVDTTKAKQHNFIKNGGFANDETIPDSGPTTPKVDLSVSPTQPAGDKSQHRLKVMSPDGKTTGSIVDTPSQRELYINKRGYKILGE